MHFLIIAFQNILFWVGPKDVYGPTSKLDLALIIALQNSLKSVSTQLKYRLYFSWRSKFFDLIIENNNLFLLNVSVIMTNDKHQY